MKSLDSVKRKLYKRILQYLLPGSPGTWHFLIFLLSQYERLEYICQKLTLKVIPCILTLFYICICDLIFSIDNDLQLKVTDNSLSRDLFPSDYHCLGDNENRPVKWLPLEALVERRFSMASDVVSPVVLIQLHWRIVCVVMSLKLQGLGVSSKIRKKNIQ